MTDGRRRTTIDMAAARLRDIVRAEPEGAFLGREDALLDRLGGSRATMRQVARLLEREGLLKVKRGNSGGYFGARPKADVLEAAVSTYLETVELEFADIVMITSVLWVEAIRKASSLGNEASRALAQKYLRKLRLLKTAAYMEVVAFEQEYRDNIFKLTGARYIELIFHVNSIFSNRLFRDQASTDVIEDGSFWSRWRDGRYMELKAIEDGDPDLGMLAARHIRKVWESAASPLCAAKRTED